MSSNSTPPSLLTLAIETSCDDTCVALLEKSGPAARLLFNKKVTSDNKAYGGVHPNTAVASHIAEIGLLVRDALRKLPESTPGHDSLPVRHPATGERTLRRLPDFISVTRGPGMLPGLSVGLSVAKGLAMAWQVPLLGVHHMQAHALTPRLVHALKQPWPTTTPTPTFPQQPTPTPSPTPSFPFLTLLASGGHTQLVLSRTLTSHAILADKHNVAIGDMLDKCGRAILPPSLTAATTSVMYGAQLESFAFPPSSSSSSSSNDYGGYRPPATRRDELKSIFFYPPASQSQNQSQGQGQGDGQGEGEGEGEGETGQGGWFLTPPLSTRGKAMEYDFSGLGGKAQQIMQDRGADMPESERRELARGLMKLAFEHLASRAVFALEEMQERRQGEERRKKTGKGKGKEKGKEGRVEKEREDEPQEIKTLVVSGGVASNKFLRRVLRDMLDVRGFKGVKIVAPPVELCTDNAVMIGWTGYEMYEAGWESELDILPVRKWSFDPSKEGGILELGGWQHRMPAGVHL
jgi:tRNA A37 threonylcarbamoyltransferase TsaD